MKTNKLIITLLVFISSISFTSCLEDGDFTVPKDLGTEENASLNSILDSISSGNLELKTIQQVKYLFTSGNDPLKIVSDVVVKGYVVSSDKTGNFYHEFYMQDAPENPTSGLKITLNLTDNYNKFNIGREVYIRLKGLFIGETNSGNGVVSIGGKVSILDNTELDNVSVNQIANHFFRSSKTEIIVPKIVNLATVNDADIGTFISLENVFFKSNLIGKAYVDPAEDFDTFRKLQTCLGLGFADILLETSSFANFANISLPEKAGTISAVVSKDFGGNFIVLNLNDPADVNMTEEKCTPLQIEEYNKILLKESFEASSGEIKIINWVNYREEGTKSWRSYADTYSQSKAARIGSKSSLDASTIAWLITKGIDLDTTSEEFLSFKTSNSFANGSNLEVLISTNWDGTEVNIASVTWTVLPAKIVSDGEGFKNWIHSTYINLSTYSGIAFIAFRYTGSGNVNFDGTYELDNIMINAK